MGGDDGADLVGQREPAGRLPALGGEDGVSQLAQAVALTSGSQPGLGAWLMISVGSVMLWSSILIFVGASVAGLVRLVRSLAGG